MKSFTIIGEDGIEYGVYDGEDAYDALDAFARDMGYRGYRKDEPSVYPWHGFVIEAEDRGRRVSPAVYTID